MTVKAIEKKLKANPSIEEIKEILLKGHITKLLEHIENTDFLAIQGNTIYYSKEIEKDNKQLVCDQYFTLLLRKLIRELFKELSEESKNIILSTDININKATTLYILKKYRITYRPN